MAYRDVVLADSPYGYWRMGSASPIHDELNAGTPARDLSLPAGGLTAVAGALTGDADQARQFSGLTDGTSFARTGGIDLSATVGTPITWEAWAWIDAYANDDKMLTEYGGSWSAGDGRFVISPNNSTGGAEANTISIGMRVATNQIFRVTVPRSAVSAAAWHHLVVVYTPTVAAASGGTAIKVYVDGAAVTTTTRQNTLTTGSGTFMSSGQMYLLARGNTTLNLAGRIDEVAIYKTELSSGRVAAHYASGTGVAPTTDIKARVAGAWVDVDRAVRAGGAWV